MKKFINYMKNFNKIINNFINKYIRIKFIFNININRI